MTLGVPQVITHRSRDAEAKGALTWTERDFDEIRRLAGMGFKVTVTGGVKPEEIPQFAGVPVFVFIAGRGIYAAADPAAAAKHSKRSSRRHIDDCQYVILSGSTPNRA